MKELSTKQMIDIRDSLSMSLDMIKGCLNYRSSLLPFDSTSSKELTYEQSKITPDFYYCFKMFDKSVSLDSDFFIYDNFEKKHKSLHSVYHIKTVGYSSKLSKPLKTVGLLGAYHLNITNFDEALSLFRRYVIDFLCVNYGYSFQNDIFMDLY